jgi:hypothetical protein
MRNGFDFYFFLTGFTGLTGFFSPAARGPSAEGRSILTILLILSNCFLKIRIHSTFLPCFDIDTCPPHMKLHHLLQKCSFFLIKLAAVQVSGAACMKLGQNGTVSFSIGPAVFLAGGGAYQKS